MVYLNFSTYLVINVNSYNKKLNLSKALKLKNSKLTLCLNVAHRCNVLMEESHW